MTNKNIDLDSDAIKVLLATSSYVPNQDTHNALDDVTNEITGTGYTTGGKQMTGITITQDALSGRAVFDADDVTWTSSSLTARGCVIYKDSGTPSTSYLVAYIDFGSNVTSSSGDFVLEWGTTGIFNLI